MKRGKAEVDNGIKINRMELLEALEKVKPGLASTENIEQSTSFAFMGDKVVTYNDEISVSHPVRGLENITGAIKATMLFDYLNKLKQNEIVIQTEENQVLIKAGKAKAGLLMEHEIVLPIEEVGEIEDWQPFPKEALDGMKFCYPRCSREMAKMELTCVHVTPNRIEASDSFQIAAFNLKNELDVKDFLIPASAVKELVKYDVKEISVGDNWVHFRTDDGTVFSSRTFVGDFPDIEPFMNVTGKTLEFPDDMLDILHRAETFAKVKTMADSFPTVEISLENQHLQVSVNSEGGWFQETSSVKYDGEPVQFSIILNLLKNMLNENNQGLINDRMIVFQGENWRHVLALFKK